MKTAWLSVQEWSDEDRNQARLVRFRQQLSLDEVPLSFRIRISADTKYRLYVNGHFVQYGPSKGDHHIWFYDEHDIAAYLQAGMNTVAVLILHYPQDHQKGSHSMFRFDLPRLFIGGMDGNGWKYEIDRRMVFYAEEERFAPLKIHEQAVSEDHEWMRNSFDDTVWTDAKICGTDDLPEVLRPENLVRRTIPLMRLEQKKVFAFDRRVEKDSSYSFVIDAKEEMTAFISLSVNGGKDSEIELLYSECYEYDSGKGKRTDSENGHLCGYRDYVRVLSDGETVYEPFWFRTFRYIQITVHAKSDLILKALSYAETGYPLQVKGSVKTSDESLKPVWDISLRTLKRCMQETYIDCPFYEQLQYVMDTRSQILYTYAISADDRLARKAIDDFSRAQRPDGLLNCSYPDTGVNVIPGFSLYYILMVHDHMMYFGDRQLVKKYLPVIHRILHFFESNLREDGILGNVGGVIGSKFWSFIDWAKPWMDTSGMPPAGLKGPITIESELYLYGLIHAAKLCEYAEDEHASVYRAMANRLKDAIRSVSMKDGLITDGPGVDDISQQAQVFAVLSGILSEEEGRYALQKTLQDESIARCTVATSFYLFRALEKTGLYEYTDQYWNIWRQMAENECTTCAEGEFYPRSECHAWGALALYELPSVILGVRPAGPGYEKILVSPCPGYMTSASGTVHTPQGDVSVAWKKTENGMDLHIETDPSLKSRIITK